MDEAETRYAVTVDGVHIAYQVHGSGSDDVVLIPGFVSNLEIDLEEPHVVRMVELMANRWRVIMFDKRGTGLSDRRYTPDLEMRADDLRAVLDAVGSESATIVGMGEGGALAAFFAASHPERVTALIPVYAWARIAWAPDYPMGMTDDAYRADAANITHRWGTLEYAREWAQTEIPSLASDERFVRWMAKEMRHAVSPGAALDFHEIWYATDVRGILGSIQTPTLVVIGETFTGAAGDEEALNRYLVDHIPGAVLETLPGGDFPPFGDTEPLVNAIDRFVESHRAERAAFDRVLTTVLFTDVVGATERAAGMGDGAWKQLLARHHEIIRAMLARYRGVEVNTAGDGFFATFDGPARAVRCAQAMVVAVRPLGLDIRAGLHTGEVELFDKDIGGLAVHIGARVGALAGPSEVLVSQTIKDLTAGSGVVYSDRGEHELKGVPDQWRLYQATG